MNISIIRQQFNHNHKRLRRARRLYGFLIREEIKQNPNMAFICAQRAIARGLYSTNTMYSTVVYSMFKHAYNADNAHGNIRGWGRWLDQYAFGSNFQWYKVRKMMKNDKPVLRLIA